VQGDAGFFEYVECHINLRQTFLMARTGRDGLAFAETADGAELCFQRGFKDTQNEVSSFVVHGGLLSMGSRGV